MKKSNPPVILVKVDATKNEEVSREYDIRGFPHLLYFRNGIEEEFTGARTEEGITSWLKKKTEPIPSITTLTDIEAAKLENDVIVVGVFSSKSDAKSIENFEEISRLLGDTVAFF